MRGNVNMQIAALIEECLITMFIKVTDSYPSCQCILNTINVYKHVCVLLLLRLYAMTTRTLQTERKERWTVRVHARFPPSGSLQPH